MSDTKIDPNRVRTELLNRFSEIQKRKPKFSVRQFAQALKTDYSALSRVLNGKRQMSEKLARHISSRLMATYGQSGLPLDVRPRSLSLAEHLLLSNWKSVVLQELTHTKGFKSDTKEIATLLGVSQEEVEGIVRALVNLGFLVQSADGRLYDSVPVWYSENFNDHPESRLANIQDLKELNQMGERVYSEKNADEFSFSNIVISIDKGSVARAKDLIADFRKNMLSLLRTRDPDSVYVVKIDFFPVIRTK